jgi:hypothetical protein
MKKAPDGACRSDLIVVSFSVRHRQNAQLPTFNFQRPGTRKHEPRKKGTPRIQHRVLRGRRICASLRHPASNVELESSVHYHPTTPRKPSFQGIFGPGYVRFPSTRVCTFVLPPYGCCPIPAGAEHQIGLPKTQIWTGRSGSSLRRLRTGERCTDRFCLLSLVSSCCL